MITLLHFTLSRERITKLSFKWSPDTAHIPYFVCWLYTFSNALIADSTWQLIRCYFENGTVCLCHADRTRCRSVSPTRTADRRHHLAPRHPTSASVDWISHLDAHLVTSSARVIRTVSGKHATQWRHSHLVPGSVDGTWCAVMSLLLTWKNWLSCRHALY